MTDKILKEAYDKMVAIEEGNEDYVDGNEFDDEHETVDASELAGKYADDSAMQRRSKDDWDTDTGPGENSNAWNEIDEANVNIDDEGWAAYGKQKTARAGKKNKKETARAGKKNKKKRVKEDSGEDLMDGIEEFTDIQDELFELIERLDSAIRAYQPRQHKYWQSYGLAQLKLIAGNDEYASSDRNINTLIQNLKDEARGPAVDGFPDDDADLYPGHPDAPSRR